jgi:hypothetical protein
MTTRALNLAQAGEMFGSWPDQDPEVFIQNMEWQMILSSVTTAAEKAHYLMLCLEVKSLANKWFQNLDLAVKTDWAQLEPTFRLQWVAHQAPEWTKLEKTKDLLNHRLKPEDVGEMVPFWGTSKYTHVVWAEEVQAMVQDLEINTRSKYIYQALNNLPTAIKDSIEGEVIDWTMFIMEVKAIKIEKLKARAKTEKEQVEKDRVMKSEINKLWSLIQMLRLENTAPTAWQAGQVQQTAWTIIAQLNPNMLVAGRNCQTCPPAMEAEKMATQQRLRTYLHQPDTDTGCTMYRWQMAQWVASRSTGDMITKAMLVPLRPGTMAICSSECFKCSTHGHRAMRCVLADNHPNCLSKEEAHWHIICRSVLRPVNRATMMGVHLLFNGQGNMWQEWGAEEHNQDQGKEEGSSV